MHNGKLYTIISAIWQQAPGYTRAILIFFFFFFNELIQVLQYYL